MGIFWATACAALPPVKNGVENWEEPKKVTALRGFLGFTNYYTTYVEIYAEIAAPLTEKLEVNKQEGKKGK